MLERERYQETIENDTNIYSETDDNSIQNRYLKNEAKMMERGATKREKDRNNDTQKRSKNRTL